MRPLSSRASRAITTFSFLATLLVVACHTDDAMPREAQSSLVRFLGGAFSDANVCNFFYVLGNGLHLGVMPYFGFCFHIPNP